MFAMSSGNFVAEDVDFGKNVMDMTYSHYADQNTCFQVPAGTVMDAKPHSWASGKCNLDSVPVKNRIAKQYDANGDGFITKQELGMGIKALPKCCGQYCPVHSGGINGYCPEYVFSPDTIDVARENTCRLTRD